MSEYACARRAPDREESSGAYAQLLRTELLGMPSALATPDRGGGGGGLAASPISRQACLHAVCMHWGACAEIMHACCSSQCGL
jgi:hypothetical protein